MAVESEKKIMIIEDDELKRRLILRNLKIVGIKDDQITVVESNGESLSHATEEVEEALSQLSPNDRLVVFLDLYLKDGSTTMEIAKELAPLLNILVIGITMESRDTLFAEAVDFSASQSPNPTDAGEVHDYKTAARLAYAFLSGDEVRDPNYKLPDEV